MRVVSTHARPAYRPIILEVVTGRPSAAAANPEILPLEFLLGDDPGSWIAEWMDRRVVRELSLLLVTLPPPNFAPPLIAFQQHP